MSVETSGDWRDERLYVLKTLEDVKEEQRRQMQVAATLSDREILKAHKDIQEAYKRIRTLEESASTREHSASTLRTKYWIITGLLSAAMGLLSPLLYEIVKQFVHR
jgi:hypothetical protein